MIKVLLINFGDKEFFVQRGARIAQLVICPVVKADLKPVDSLDETSRGEGASVTLDDFTLYAELVSQIRSCEKCALSRNRKNAVPGEGNLRSQIMFVGEGPGAEEDLQGSAICRAKRANFLIKCLLP